MYVIQGTDSTASTATARTDSLTLDVLDSQTARVSPPDGDIITGFNNTTLTETRLWSQAERDVFLNVSNTHTTFDHNELHIDDNVGTRFILPTFTRSWSNVSYSAAEEAVLFNNIVDQSNFFSEIPGTEVTVGGRFVLRPSAEVSISLGGFGVVVGPTRSQVRTTTADHLYFAPFATLSNQQGFQILNTSGQVISDPLGANDIAATTLTATDGDDYVITGYNAIDDADLDTYIWPADRCRWRVSPDARAGYEIHDAQFYPGNGAPVSITNAELGFIGKSGRFVRIAN